LGQKCHVRGAKQLDQRSVEQTLIDVRHVAPAVWKRFRADSGTFIFFGSNPFMPGLSLGEKEKKQLTPEEQERQKQLDAAYKAAQKKIPDQKAADPWGGVRPTPTVDCRGCDCSGSP
jgi:hypothetical protein